MQIAWEARVLCIIYRVAAIFTTHSWDVLFPRAGLERQRERRRIRSILGEWEENAILSEKQVGVGRKKAPTGMSGNDLFHKPDPGYPGSSKTGNCEIQENNWDSLTLPAH